MKENNNLFCTSLFCIWNTGRYKKKLVKKLKRETKYDFCFLLSENGNILKVRDSPDPYHYYIKKLVTQHKKYTSVNNKNELSPASLKNVLIATI